MFARAVPRSRALLQVALLRAVNLGAHNKVAMSDLRDLLDQLGFEEPRSLLQSGNLVFRAVRPAGASLERLLETEAEKRLQLRTEFLFRNATEWKRVVDGNPFPDEAARDPGHLVVMFFKDVLRADAVKALQAALIEKKLGSRGTGRNWNTVLKLDALAVE